MPDGEEVPKEGSLGGPSSVSLEDVEAGQAKPKMDLTKIQFDDNAPDEVKGKTAAEVIEQNRALAQALRISEESRKNAEALAQLAAKSNTAPAAAAAPVPEPVQEMPAEELAQLMQTDPVKAVQVIQEQTARKVDAQVRARLGPLASGASGLAEATVRQKYPDEFALFNDEIQKYVSSLPNKEVLSNPQAWDDLISYVRGRPGNFEKLFDHRAAKSRTVDAEAARAREAASVGFTGRPANTQMPKVRGRPLDSTEREIARELNLSDEDYIHWRDLA